MSSVQKLFAICGTLLGAGAIVAACSGTPRETTMNAPVVDDEVMHPAADYRTAEADPVQVAGDAGVPRTGSGTGSNRPGTGSGSGMNPGTGSGSGRGPGSGTLPNRPAPTNPAPTPTPAPTNPH
jgi:hypothetical protein